MYEKITDNGNDSWWAQDWSMIAGKVSGFKEEDFLSFFNLVYII